MKKITFIGKGNAGCFGALHFSTYTNYEIELIYDPDTPEEKVGQATVLEAPDLLWRGLGLDWFNNSIEATPKFGVLYENWSKKEKPFFHPFSFNNTAVHYAPKKLQNAIINSGRFKVKEQKINEPKEVDSDFIFDCRGKLWNKPEQYESLDNPLNSVLLKQTNFRVPNVNWTRCVATPDGWTFVIPNTNNTTSHGYLYNKDITSKEKAINNFKKIFEVDDPIEGFDFSCYIAKNPIQDNVILSGNRLFFLEPLEATAVQTYLQWYRYCYDYIIEGFSKEEITKQLKKYVKQTEQFILWHYLYGSKYDTEFWKHCSSNYKITDPDFAMVLAYAKAESHFNLRNKKLLSYGQFHPVSFKYWDEYVNSR